MRTAEQVKSRQAKERKTMPTSTYGPYFQYNVILGAGQSWRVPWGPWPSFGSGTVSVTGHPNTISRDNEVALQTTNIIIKAIDKGHGDIDAKEYSMTADFINTGTNPIEQFAVWITVNTQ
jgi:hypothetical protein